MGNVFDFAELVKRAIKYIVEGLMVAIAAYAIPKQSLKVEEVVIIALTAAATFSVLDVFVPSMASSEAQSTARRAHAIAPNQNSNGKLISKPELHKTQWPTLSRRLPPTRTSSPRPT